MKQKGKHENAGLSRLEFGRTNLFNGHPQAPAGDFS